jgi:hypothetical protein
MLLGFQRGTGPWCWCWWYWCSTPPRSSPLRHLRSLAEAPSPSPSPPPGGGLALVRAVVQLGAVGHGGQEEEHAVVVERGAPLARRGVDCVEDMVGVAEGRGLQRGRERGGRVLAEGRWRAGRRRAQVRGWVCIVRGMGWVLRVLILFLFFSQEFERVESLALYLIREGNGGSMALRCGIERNHFCGGFVTGDLMARRWKGETSFITASSTYL